MAIPPPSTQAQKSKEYKQKNPLEDLVPESSDLISPAVKGKTKLDEVTDAAMTIFGGRVLDTQ
ncbi:MAG: hypothetical protein OXU45_06810 [Candidatus Melainabacteria bacterium]|nr:hypothetical protein [Candidatus Melainabacteria bacterium]